jgi:hypothetical protein
MIARRTIILLAVALAINHAVARAHDGPPFPILSDYTAGPYRLAIWTDPDTTDDGSPGGQFWIRVHRAADGTAVPAGTRATVRVTPVERTGSERTAAAEPVRGDVTNQFAAVVMDHEGRFTVNVTVDGPLGTASANAAVDATYDLRPAPYLLFLYLTPFVIIGILWVRVIARRRRAGAESSG